MNRFGVTNPCTNIANAFGVQWEYVAYVLENELAAMPNADGTKRIRKIRQALANQRNNVSLGLIVWPGETMHYHVLGAVRLVVHDMVRMAKDANQGA